MKPFQSRLKNRQRNSLNIPKQTPVRTLTFSDATNSPFLRFKNWNSRLPPKIHDQKGATWRASLIKMLDGLPRFSKPFNFHTSRSKRLCAYAQVPMSTEDTAQFYRYQNEESPETKHELIGFRKHSLQRDASYESYVAFCDWTSTYNLSSFAHWAHRLKKTVPCTWPVLEAGTCQNEANCC